MSGAATVDERKEACFFCGDAALGVAEDGTPTCGGDGCEPVDPDFFGEEDDE